MPELKVFKVYNDTHNKRASVGLQRWMVDHLEDVFKKATGCEIERVVLMEKPPRLVYQKGDKHFG